MRTQIVLRFLAVLAVAALVAACGPTASPQRTMALRPSPTPSEGPVAPTEAAATPEPPAQVHLVGPRSTGYAGDLQRDLLDQCGVTYELLETDYYSALQAKFAAGEQFDLFAMDSYLVPSFAQQGFLAPLDDAAYVTTDEFLEPLLWAFTYEDTLYGIPKDFSTLALFYNTDLFAQAGLDEPNNDWTWDDLKKAARSLKDGAGAYGFSVPAVPYVFSAFVLQNGSQIITPDFSDTELDSWPAIEAGQFYTDARWEEWAVLPRDVDAGWTGEAFGRGAVAMVLEGDWLRSYLSNAFPDLPYSAVHPPAGPSGEGNLVFAFGYALSPYSSNPEGAMLAIACLTSEEAQLKLLQSGVALPSRKSLEGQPYLLDHPVANALFSGVWGAVPYGWGPHFYEVNRAIEDALMRVYDEGWSVEESFKWAAEEEIRPILGK